MKDDFDFDYADIPRVSDRTFGAAIGVIAVIAGIMVACLVMGCAACKPCKGAEVAPSPQQGAPSKWRPAAIPLPTPPVPPPVPPTPPRDFATPPIDGPDDPVVPPTPQVVPAPAPPVVPKPVSSDGTAEMTTSSKASGAINILGNTGSIVLGNSGAIPSTQSPPQMAPQQIPIGLITAVATSPAAQSFALAATKRVGQAVSVLFTGHCPTPAVAAAPQMMALQAVPTVSYQAVPVQMMAAPQQVAAPVYTYQAAPQAAPIFAPMSLPMMAPTPAAPKKCGLFGR